MTIFKRKEFRETVNKALKVNANNLSACLDLSLLEEI